MTSQANWIDPSGPLLRLAAVLDIASGTLASKEKADALLIRNDQFPAEIARRLTLDVLRPLIDTYGEALKFEFRLGGLSLEVNAQTNQTNIDQFQTQIARSPTVVLDLKLDKTKLLKLWGAEHPDAVIKLFLFPVALSRELSVSLVDLEQGIMREADGKHKLVILVPSDDIELNGDYLAVIGGPATANWQTYLPSMAPNPTRVTSVYAEALKSLKWAHFTLNFLTPLQLKVSGKASLNNPVALALYAQQLALSLVYTADQTRVNKTDHEVSWRATYAAESYVAEIAIGNAATLQQILASVSVETDPWALPQALAEIAEWAYNGERGGSDRVNVLQGVIAHALQGNDPLLNYRQMILQAGHLKQEVEWGWAAFIEGKLNTYFSRVRDVEQAVDALVKSYNDQVQSLTKTLTDSVLAAVGVVVGSFIAAVFKDKFNPAIFQLGLLVYACYLFFFPGLIGLISTWQRYQDTRLVFEKRKTDFGKRLFPDEVDKIVGDTVRVREDWFEHWFITVAIIYAVVILLLIVAVIAVPGLIGSTPTATPAMISPIVTPTP